MNKQILIAGFACLSLFAAAQSQSNESKGQSSKAAEVKSPRDHASGQSSGRAASQKPADHPIVHRDLAARESPTRQSTGNQSAGKKTAHDDWQQTNAVSSGNAPSVKDVSAGDLNGDGKSDRVATGDVNGDGTSDAAATKSSSRPAGSAATLSDPAKGSAPRDAATGQATGKRMHKPLTITKEADRGKQ